MGLGEWDIYFIGDWDIQLKVHLKLKQKANKNKIYSTDLNIKQIYEIINKSTTKEHFSAKLKYINTFNVTESEFEKKTLFTIKVSVYK